MRSTLYAIFFTLALCNIEAQETPLETPLTLEHAVTPAQRTQGLSGRASLPPDHGMLFHFDPPEPICIWMYQTLIDLSLAFLDEKGTIREIHELKAYPAIHDPAFFSAHSVTSGFPASYALEMNSHWFRNHDVKTGDRLIWEGKKSKGIIKVVPNP